MHSCNHMEGEHHHEEDMFHGRILKRSWVRLSLPENTSRRINGLMSLNGRLREDEDDRCFWS